MENENRSDPRPIDEEINSATLCGDCEELSVCNCENSERVTPYRTDAPECDTEEDFFLADSTRKESKAETFARKCREVSDACRSTADRLATAWKKTKGRPYVRQTTVCRVEVYDSPHDETPVDVFYTEKTKGYSAKTFAVIGTVTVALMLAAECVMHRILK